METPSWLDRAAWPYAPRWFPLDSARLHYVDEGGGPPLVLVHGTPTWSFEWRHVIAGLKDRHRIVAADHLGFGLSDRPASASYTPEAHAARFAKFIDHAVPEGPMSLVVHDFGGPIALDWALDHADRLARIVIVNSWMWSFEDDALMKKRATIASGSLGRFLYRYLNFSQRVIMPSAYGNKKALTREIHRQYLPVFPDAASRELVLFAVAKALLGSSAFYQRLWDRRNNLARVPMTVIWGMSDSAFGPALLDRWIQAFPHAAIERIKGAGHWPHEEQPREFLAALQRA